VRLLDLRRREAKGAEHVRVAQHREQRDGKTESRDRDVVLEPVRRILRGKQSEWCWDRRKAEQ
jgi:hypothetical protein